MIDGKEYILEMPIRPDYAFIRAHKADTYGNLIYWGVYRADQPVMAMAAQKTIAEVDEIVEIGDIDPEHVVTPSIFVDGIVKVPENGYGSNERARELNEKAHGKRNGAAIAVSVVIPCDGGDKNERKIRSRSDRHESDQRAERRGLRQSRHWYTQFVRPSYARRRPFSRRKTARWDMVP